MTNKLDQNWKFLQEKADIQRNWLSFYSPTRGGVRTDNLGNKRIFAGYRIFMSISLDFNNHQVILLNKSSDEQCLICPSLGYAPNPIIENCYLGLPQAGSWAYETDEGFIFETEGSEEFLALVLKTHLNLPWLAPQENESLPEWNVEHFNELLKCLGKEENWQVFYQCITISKRHK
jgi:hypothetical protein